MKRVNSAYIKYFVSKPLFDQSVILKKDLHQPKISIVTPSYNQAKFLERAILSVINQNYPNLEYIIIDGGSMDRSIEIIRKYEKHLAYWVSEPDKGQAHALNKGIAQATGDIIGWQNSDDLYEPKSFELAASWFLKNPECDVLYGDIRVIDAHSKTIKYVKKIDFHFPTFFYENSIISNQAMFWRSSIAHKVGLFDDSLFFCMDFDFLCRLVIAGARFCRISEVLGAFRLHNASKTANYLDRLRREEKFLRKKHFGRDHLGLWGTFIRPWLRLRRKYLQVTAWER